MNELIETDREKSPLMKDLHELGLKYGVAMTVVAVNLEGPPAPHAYWIDHKDDTTAPEAALAFEGTGVYLIKVAHRIDMALAEEAEPG